MSNHEIKEEIQSGGSIQNNGKPAPQKPEEKKDAPARLSSVPSGGKGAKDDH